MAVEIFSIRIFIKQKLRTTTIALLVQGQGSDDFRFSYTVFLVRLRIQILNTPFVDLIFSIVDINYILINPMCTILHLNKLVLRGPVLKFVGDTFALSKFRIVLSVKKRISNKSNA